MSARVLAPVQAPPRQISRCSRFATHRLLSVSRTAAGAGEAAAAPSRDALFSSLESAINGVSQLPPSQRREGAEEAAPAIRKALTGLREVGATRLWGSATKLQRRSIAAFELRQIGIKEPEAIGRPSIRNDAAFLGTVVLGSSFVAVVLGVTLPGDWGAFGAYLSGGVSLAVLAVGSTAPGLLEIPIQAFSSLFPDYRERVVAHEAAHFLIAHILGIPVVSYSLAIGQEHTDLLEAGLQRKIVRSLALSISVPPHMRTSHFGIGGRAAADRGGARPVGRARECVRPPAKKTFCMFSLFLHRLANAVSGVAAEAMRYPEVVGQNQDLFDLQKLINRTSPPLTAGTQQNLTRWAVWQAAAILKREAAAFDRLREAMAARRSTVDCIRAIEGPAM